MSQLGQFVTEVSMAVGAASLLVVGLATEGLPDVPLRLAAIIAWLAVVNTAAAFTWWNVCLRGLPATEMAAINTTMAVQIPLLGWIVFGEALGWRECLGLAIVVAAVLLVVTSTTTPTTADGTTRTRRTPSEAWSAPEA